MNARGDNESVFLETPTLLPYFPSSTTLCQRSTYWKMHDELKSNSDVLIASIDNLLLSLFDFCNIADDDNGWLSICAALQVKLRARDEKTTVIQEPYQHFDDTVTSYDSIVMRSYDHR